MLNESEARVLAGKYQGNPCKRGHTGLRYRSTKGCVDCAQDAAKKQIRGKHRGP